MNPLYPGVPELSAAGRTPVNTGMYDASAHAAAPSADELLQLLSAKAGGHLCVDANGRVAWASSSASALLSCELPQLLGTLLSDWLMPLDETLPEGTLGARLQQARRAETGEVTLDCLTTAGTPLHLRLSPAGLSSLMDGVLVQVGPLRAEAASSNALLQLYAGFFAHASHGLAIVTLNGRLLDVNPTLCGWLGQESVALRRITWGELTHSDDWRTEQAQLRALARGTSDRYVLEKRMRCRNGDWLAVRVSVGAVRRADKRIEFLAIGVEDLRERNALEQRLLKTQRLEAVGRLAGGIAHDFNNLLTAILAELPVAEQSHHPEIVSMADGIREAVGRAANLTSRLLAFAQRQVQRRQLIDLAQVVRDEQGLISGMLGPNIALELGLSSQQWSLYADRNHLTQVLFNLVLNARDAMPHGGRLLLGSANIPAENCSSLAGEDTEPGDHVMLIVADTGQGMPARVAEHAFEPFFTTKEAADGSGLGLATCHGIVRQCGGRIQITSSLGHGTTVRVLLPRRDAPAVSAPPPTVVAQPATQVTILLVEDDNMVRRVAGRVLARAGYRVLSAASPEQALALARTFEESIQLILSDLQMPGMDGRQLAIALAPLRPESQVLFTSGYSDAVLDEDFAALPFLPKPYTPQQLVERVAELVGVATVPR